MAVQWRTSKESAGGAHQRRISVDSLKFNFGETPPKNPEGRVGTAGKGLLPEMGENPACIFVVTRGRKNEEILVLKGVHYHAQFPWVGGDNSDHNWRVYLFKPNYLILCF